MLLTKRIILSLTLSLIGVGVFAQSADDIISKYIDAMGGKAKLLQLNSLYEEMTTSVMGQDIPGKVWIVNNKGMRTEMTVMSQKMVTVMTKDTGWMVSPMSPDPQPLPSDQIKQAIARLDLRGQLLDYKAKGYVVNLLGQTPVDGKACYKLKITKGTDESYVFYIDAATYLISKIETQIKAQGTDVTTEIGMSDYRKTPEGYSFPYKTTISMSGNDIVSVINKVTVNPTVDPAIFTKP